MSEILKDYFENAYKNNKIGQAYLIGNISLDDIYSQLNDILSNYFFHDKIDLSENSDVFVLKDDGKIITKSDVLKIQEHILLTSQFSNYKIYIIDGAERMNLSAANSLLKTLEEPEENVIAVLVTKNINNIIPTIKSRCQIINLSSELSSSFNIEYKNDALELAKYLEKFSIDTIAYENVIFDKTIQLDKFKEIINMLFVIYKTSLNYILYDDFNDNLISKEEFQFIIDNNDISTISKKLIVIHDIMSLASLNLNVGLLTDRFIIEFGRCKDE